LPIDHQTVCLLLFAVLVALPGIYGLHLYVLMALVHRRRRDVRRQQDETIRRYRRGRREDDWPTVTTQLPIYNEVAVAERVIRAVAALDYPAGRHEIQVLDDSTDATREIVDRVCAELTAAGVEVRVIRRESREHFKAGALAHGLRQARGRYVAIFDADFVPDRGFLRRMVPLIDSDPQACCVQGRWGHLNRDENWLTRAMALGMDGHFGVEQGARAWSGLLLNFNGTAGIWRKAAIEDPRVGGWSGDTLTEDLDLSYRAQLAGWRIDYDLDLACPAELPGTVAALKSQQRRWATGSIQVARKLLPRIWRAPISLGEKLEATLHLTHYSVAVWMLLLALIARPMVLVYNDGRLGTSWAWIIWGLIVLAALAPSLVYAYARHRLGGGWSGLRTIPSMLVLGCGMSVNNTLAVIRGLYLRGGEFVRTPKSGSVAKHVRRSIYTVAHDRMWIAEILLGVYAAASFVLYFNRFSRFFSFFLALYALGFLLIGWMSMPRRLHGHKSSRTTRVFLPDKSASPEPAGST